MPELSAVGSSTALIARWLDKIIVYVESEADRQLFTRIVGNDVRDKLEFRPVGVLVNGCAAVIKEVASKRGSNKKIFGLVDGETAAWLGAVDGLLDCRAHLFTLPGVEGADGIMFLSGHELENLILLHGEVCDLVAKNVKLAALGTIQASDVEHTLTTLTKRFFIAALFKYTAFMLFQRKVPVVTLTGGKLIDLKLRPGTWLLELRQAVEAQGADWQVYRQEAKDIARRLIAAMNAEAMTPELRRHHFVRLADGKHMLTAIQQAHGRSVAEGILADALTKPPYANEFREQLMEITQAA